MPDDTPARSRTASPTPGTASSTPADLGKTRSIPPDLGLAPPVSPTPAAASPAGGASPRDRATGIIAFAVVLTLLYLGRDVLIPLTLALMLSLLIAPLVSALRRIGLGQTGSVLAAVLALTLLCAATAVVLGTQVLRMAASLPQYQEEIQQKLHNLDELTVGRLNSLTSEVTHLIDSHGVTGAVTTPALSDELATTPVGPSPIPLELPQPRTPPFQLLGRVLASVWVPLETTGIVLVVLLFVLLEREALRDRFIRVIGGTDIRLITLALNDAGERLSRFFVSQFAVNLGVGAAIGLGLALLGLPHAMLWGALAAILRFVPYVGIWIAALFPAALALAVVPGWSLAVSTVALFIVVEVIAGQAVEPQLYGHTTGLSPLSVVVAAIFWSALWGPMGLILSTPLTLCILVGGRHVRALRFLDLLLGDTQALTLPQKFYQRALSGDSNENIEVARAFLKRNTLADYCDLVLLPALHLAILDLELGVTTKDQQLRIRSVIVAVVSAIDGENVRPVRQRDRASVLNTTSGQLLRQQRELRTGKWQGPLNVPAGSVMICVGLGSMADDLAAELLVRILRGRKLDARHFSVDDSTPELPEGATADAVAVVYLVSAFPGAERLRRDSVAEKIAQQLPGASLVNVFLPGMSVQPEPAAQPADANRTVTSFVQALQLCHEQQQQRTGST